MTSRCRCRPGEIDDGAVESDRRAFEKIHEQLFGSGSGDRAGGIDFTAFQVRATAQTRRPSCRRLDRRESAGAFAQRLLVGAARLRADTGSRPRPGDADRRPRTDRVTGHGHRHPPGPSRRARPSRQLRHRPHGRRSMNAALRGQGRAGHRRRVRDRRGRRPAPRRRGRKRRRDGRAGGRRRARSRRVAERGSVRRRRVGPAGLRTRRRARGQELRWPSHRRQHRWHQRAVGQHRGLPVDDWRRVIGINLDGVYYSLRAELNHMLDHGGGSIVNMASMFSVVGRATDDRLRRSQARSARHHPRGRDRLRHAAACASTASAPP